MQAQRAIDRFLASPRLGEATRRSYRGDVEEFGRWLERRQTAVEAVDVRVLTEYVTDLGRARHPIKEVIIETCDEAFRGRVG